MSSNTESVASPPDVAPTLEYGRARRQRRRAVLLVVAAMIVTGCVWAFLSRDDLLGKYARWQGRREVRAWLKTAPQATIPTGTMLFTSRPEDEEAFVAAGGTWTRSHPGSKGTPFGFQVDTYPQLRTLVYQRDKVASVVGGNTVYVGAHSPWGTDAVSTEPVLVELGYYWRQRGGLPDFGLHYVADRPHRVARNRAMGEQFDASGVSIQFPDLDPALFDGLRLYAGEPHPDDPSRFSIPFDSYAGAGRFEFDTDSRNTHNGPRVPWPEVRILWDSRTTRETR